MSIGALFTYGYFRLVDEGLLDIGGFILNLFYKHKTKNIGHPLQFECTHTTGFTIPVTVN